MEWLGIDWFLLAEDVGGRFDQEDCVQSCLEADVLKSGTAEILNE